MQPLNYDTIYAGLNPAWWVDTFPTDANTPWPTANIYFQDVAGNTNYFVSTGIETGTGDRTNTVNRLRAETAQYLVVGHCTGGITNVRPGSFQPMPIYFK